MSLTSARAAYAKKKAQAPKKPPKQRIQPPPPSPGEKKRRGRPPCYSDEVADELCRRYALKENLASILQDARMPGKTAFHDWMTKHANFAAKFARARELRGVMRVDENDVVARGVLDGKVDPNAGRTFIMNNQWAAAREAPRHYGDRLQAELSGPDGGPVQVEAAAAVKALIEALPELGVLAANGTEAPPPLATPADDPVAVAATPPQRRLHYNQATGELEEALDA